MELMTNFETRPDVFSRRALEMTVELLQQHHEGLASDIQNQLLINSYSLEHSFLYNPQDPGAHQEHYQVTLSAQTIGKVVDALTKLGEKYISQAAQNNAQLCQIKKLIQEWVSLAEWLIIQADPPTQSLH